MTRPSRVLNEALQKLTVYNFNTSNWDVDKINTEGLSDEEMAKNIMFLHKKQSVREVIAHGKRMKCWASPELCTEQQFVKFLEWMRGDSGKDFLQKAERKRIVEKKTVANDDIVKTAFVCSLKEQLKEIKKKKRSLMLVGRNKGLASEKVQLMKHQMKPGGQYKEMSESARGKRCNALYSAKHPRTSITDELVKKNKKDYGEEATTNHMFDFLNVSTNRNLLVQWVETKIDHYSNVDYIRRELNKFVAYGESIGANIPSSVLYLLENGPVMRKMKDTNIDQAGVVSQELVLRAEEGVGPTDTVAT